MVVLCTDEQPEQKLQINGQTLRRTSARLRTLKESRNSNADANHPTRKREAPASNKLARGEKRRKTVKPEVNENGQEVNQLAAVDCGGVTDSSAVENGQEMNQLVAVDCGGVTDSSAVEKGAHAKVTETLRAFNKHYLHSIQEEENRCARQAADSKKNVKTGSKSKVEENSCASGKADLKKKMKKDSKSKKEDTAGDKRPSKRPDLKAISEMIKTQAVLNSEKRLGSIPGIDVGHQFFSRAEMVVVGFHQHWLNGIDYIGQCATAARKSSKELTSKGYKLPLAVSIVLSGQYEDDLDNCEDIVYTGQGGNDLLGNKRQISDQVLERGNLALKNSMDESLPVRVVRGHKCQSSYVGKVYTYDGLYKVVKYWAEKGVSGFTVYKFRLKRIEGQPPLTTKEVYFTRGRIPESVSEIRGLVCEDITDGKEEIPIPVTNLVDDTPIAPGYRYIKKMEFAKNISVPSITPTGCTCRGACVDPRSCACARLNGGDFPYVHRNGGRLVEPKGVVFECGPNCGCGPKCVNRTSQNGIRFRLEVFRTPRMGWGVRSWDYIPSGAPICEYIGRLRRTDELSTTADNSYVFDIDCLQTMKGLEGRESRLRDVSLPSYLQKISEETSESVPFCIDAADTGNIARFINHSCEPNLFVQCMLSDHHDPKLARVMLIAADNIPPLKELTYDYAYALDSVLAPDGTILQLNCLCGADGCRKRLY